MTTDPISTENMSDALHALHRSRRQATADNVAAQIRQRQRPTPAAHLSDEHADAQLYRAGAYRTIDGDIVVGDTEETR